MGIIKTIGALGFMPKHTYYVGDAISDIQAARDAGCIAVCVLSGMGTKPQLENTNPDMLFKDVSAMADHFVRKLNLSIKNPQQIKVQISILSFTNYF